MADPVVPVVVPPVVAPVVEPPPKVEPKTPVVETPPVGGATTASKAPKELADHEEPTAGESYTLTSDAFRKRIERGTKKELERQFGTSDATVLKGKLQRLEEFETKAEEERKKTLTEVQRLQEESAAATQRAEAAEQRALDMENDRLVSQDEQQLKEVASEFIEPKFWRHAQTDLATHLYDTYGSERLEQMSTADAERAVNEFFAGYVKENPELARKRAPDAAVVKPTVVDKPLVNGNANPKGRGPNAKPAPNVITSGPFAGKTAAPGHPNSMTAAEYQQWKRSTGNNY